MEQIRIRCALAQSADGHRFAIIEKSYIPSADNTEDHAQFINIDETESPRENPTTGEQSQITDEAECLHGDIVPSPYAYNPGKKSTRPTLKHILRNLTYRGAHQRKPRRNRRSSQSHRQPPVGIAVGLTAIAVILALTVFVFVNAFATRPADEPTTFPITSETPAPFQTGIETEPSFVVAEDPVAAMFKASAKAYEHDEVYFYSAEELDYFIAREVRQLMADLVTSEGSVAFVGQTGTSQIAWTVLNRYSSGIAWFGTTLEEVMTKEYQYTIDQHFTATEMAIVNDVCCRWLAEINGVTNSGRTLPRDVYFYEGDGVQNYFYKWSSGGLGQPSDLKLYYDGYLGSPYAD